RQRADGIFATGYAFVDFFAGGHAFGIGAATRMATLTTLGLRQQGVDLVDDGIAFHIEFHRGKAEQGAKDHGHGHQHNNRTQIASQEFHTAPRQILIRPEKPMNARDISPAVIMPMDAPLNGVGTSDTRMRSRMAANSTSTSEKPSAPPK